MKKTIFAILSLCAVAANAYAGEVYVRERPPFSDAGTVHKGLFYYFTNSRDETCDLVLKGSCYVNSNQRATVLKKGIIEVGSELYCSKVPDTMGRSGYTLGNGICTRNGWIPRRDQ